MARDPEAVTRAATSLLDRIKSTARNTSVDTRTLITRFALERWLHRLEVSGVFPGFVLKGGMIMPLLGEGHRPTEDIDGNLSEELGSDQIATAMRIVCGTDPVQEDGLVFDASDMRIDPIREGLLPGARVTLRAWLRPKSGNATEIKIKLDLCFGDAITPDAELATLPPSIRGLDPVTLPVFPWATVVSEKIHAIARHGLANSRMKDFYDLVLVSRVTPMDGQTLVDAVIATFRRWGGAGPTAELPGLSPGFAHAKKRDWAAFLRRGGVRADMPDFPAVVDEVSRFVTPILSAAQTDSVMADEWHPSAGWSGRQTPVLGRT